jgi:TetR/AcrR family transcriptional regulator, transcriptional repressor for nem operon
VTETRDSIIEVAIRLTQMSGFNAFSYADISSAVGIRKASIHHHFPAKADLGVAMVERYREAFREHLGRIDAKGGKSEARLIGYVKLYESSLANDRMCLCGMLASDAQTLAKPIQGEISAFFDEQVAWLVSILERGRGAGELAFDGSSKARARLFLAALQGALLVSRGIEDKQFFTSAVKELVRGLLPVT